MGVKIVETSIRDGHQSLFATRMTTDEVLSVVQEIDKAGYHAFEVWGGATFDACLRFLNEDPWERLRKIKSVCKNTKLQMLFRGQNILGYRHYSDDVVDMFVKKSIENGIDIIRVFDALNDIRNLKQTVESTNKYGGHCQIAVSYTTSPIHTVEYFAKLAKEIEKLGAHSLCIKDMAGVLTPDAAYELVTKIKENTKLPIELHSHCTGGICELTYMKAIEAGVDIIDCALSPLSNGTSQPSTQVFNTVLKGTKFDPKLNDDMLNNASEKLNSIRNKYLEAGILDPKALSVNPNILTYQVPGGMLSNLMNQLKAQNSLHLYDEVLKEVPKVRKELGYPPLVTPLSQMVGTQSVLNVLSNERYKIVPKEITDYCHGRYGKSPGNIDKAILEKVVKDENEVITCRPADLLKPEFNELKEKYKNLIRCDEDVLSIALFESVAIEYLKNVKDANEVEEFNVLLGGEN